MTGFLLLDKTAGMTSFAATAKCRRLFATKKAGHTGTLDPMATGVLVVALGAATRFIDLLPSSEKAYRADFRLGETTDTLDSTGTVLTIAAFIWALILILKRLIIGDYNVSGWTSMICVIIFLGGIQLLSIGIMGQYIAKIFLETKHRPLYIVAESSEDGEEAIGERGNRE